MALIEEGFFKRNKKILLISLIIFLVSACAGGIYAYMTIGDQYGMITEAISHNHNAFGDDPGFTAEGFFSHNAFADLLEILGGFFLSIPSLIILIFNAASIGTMFGSDFTFACLSILPHGVIEYSASVLALAIAFLITKLEIQMVKNRSVRGTLVENTVVLKDILVLFIVVFILLFVAAIIEANLTILVIKSYFGI